MDYFDLMNDAKLKGVATQDKMWQSIDAMYDVLALVEEEHPDEYHKMMRCQHEILYGPHYNESFAKYDVSKIHYTSRDGRPCSGGYWTKDQIMEATKNYTFPAGTTDWDRYVALNSFFADTSQVLDDNSVIKAALQFYFKDEDGPEDNGKIWHYMSAMKG